MMHLNMKKWTIIMFLTLLPVTIFAQEPDKKQKLKSKGKLEIIDTLTDEFLDTVQVKKKLKLNDYSMIGFQYGASLSQVMWNPTQKQDMVFVPVNLGVTYTLYGKMFGYMPYFGIQTGVFYAREGYKFKYNEDRDYTYTIEGAEKAIMDVIEVPVLSHIHFDFWHFKIIAQLGLFAGYRMKIERFPGDSGYVKDELKYSFTKTDNRFDYGLKGGLGFGLVFDPIEIHIQAMYKHSLSSLYEPDHYSPYYYRFAYPSNIIISAGVHFQLTKRSGMTRKELKRQAREIVYGNE
ncbi:MAG: PorT family protein [Bacteroidales bacterium]|nr:PorT family protein [Bacteroidales bacterium]